MENIKRIEKVLINTLVDDSLSFPSDNPVEKIDYIFVSKDIKINRAKILDEIFSDHLPHLAIINWEKKKKMKAFYKNPWKSL